MSLLNLGRIFYYYFCRLFTHHLFPFIYKPHYFCYITTISPFFLFHSLFFSFSPAAPQEKTKTNPSNFSLSLYLLSLWQGSRFNCTIIETSRRENAWKRKDRRIENEMVARDLFFEIVVVSTGGNKKKINRRMWTESFAHLYFEQTNEYGAIAIENSEKSLFSFLSVLFPRIIDN